MSPTTSRAAVSGTAQERLHQQDVDHRGLVDPQKVAVELSPSRLKTPPLGSISSSRWIVFLMLAATLVRPPVSELGLPSFVA
jgi:hypothetical protein